MIASIVGVLIVRSRGITDVMKPLNLSFYVAAGIAIALNYVFATHLLGDGPVAHGCSAPR